MVRAITNHSMRLLSKGIYLFAASFPLIAGTASSADTFEKLEKLNSPRWELKGSLIAESKKNDAESSSKSEVPLVLISEVLIEGLEGHPSQKRLEYEAYDAMNIRPGSRVTREEVTNDLNAIYATGWFSGASIEPVNTPLGVQLLVKLQPNPALTDVVVKPQDSKITKSAIKEIFRSDFGKTLNLNVLQLRMKKLKKWYLDRGYSLAKISGPNRVSLEGVVELNVVEGIIKGIEYKFLDDEGNTVRDNGKPVKGKTKTWVIERQLSTKTGLSFNRKSLEEDIKRLYATSLFSDIKVTLKPIPGEPGNVKLILGLTEQRTGSLTGGLGYSGAQGAFGSLGLQESNLLGRSWSTDLNFTYGEYGALIRFSLSDPWIKGDKHKTSFRTSFFISRDVPQVFRSTKGGLILGVSEYYRDPADAATDTAYDVDYYGGPYNTVTAAKAGDPNTSWYEYEGDSIVLQRSGGGFSFSRPLNGGDPFKKAAWSVLLGMQFEKVEPIDFSAKDRPFGMRTAGISNNSSINDGIICVAFNCATENSLLSVKSATSYNNLNDAKNPTSGNFFSVGTEQYFSLGEDSPAFNRTRMAYSHFFPLKLLKFHKGCRPKAGEKYNCPQALGFQLKAGHILGDLPPYEAFCIGGSKSIRGWKSCDLAVSRSFGEASVEYRFPIWRMISGSLFVDGGTDMGSQDDVPGKPGLLLQKQGAGYSVGSGAVFNTPVGPLRIEAASKDLSGDWRYNLGFGWKF